MLAQLYEDGAVLLEGAEGSFCASEVAFFEEGGIVWVGIELERGAVAEKL
jgi:hypothetical protein